MYPIPSFGRPGLELNLLKYRYLFYAVEWNHNRTVSGMILVIAVAFLQIRAIPQTSLSAFFRSSG
jgi:hypothetical protein